MGIKMKRVIYKLFFAILLVMLATPVTNAQREKLAQTGFKFLSVPTDARAAAMGESFTSLTGNSGALFYNPATMAFSTSMWDVSFGVNKWIADINYLYGSAAFEPFGSVFGKFGITVVNVDYGELQGTIVDGSSPSGYRDVDMFKPTAFSFGIGYANALSDKFSLGANVKLVRQNLGQSVVDIDSSGNLITEENALNAIAFDFGILYKTGFKSLNFGMSVRNFSTELKYKEAGFQLPLLFKIGLSMDVLDFVEINKEEHTFLVSVDASHPRDYPEQVFIGGEYTFMKTFSLRGGYSFPNDERNVTMGVGLNTSKFGFNLAVDYAYIPFGIFNNVHNLSVKFIY